MFLLYQNETAQLTFYKELQQNYNKLHYRKIDILTARLNYLENTTLRKPSYNAQGCLLYLPDGSAYVPVLFKDEATLKKYRSGIQWQDNLEGQQWPGYYDFKKLFVPGE